MLRKRLSWLQGLASVRCAGHCYDAPVLQAGEQVHGALVGTDGGAMHVPLGRSPCVALVDEPVLLAGVLAGRRDVLEVLPPVEPVLEGPVLVVDADRRTPGAWGERVLLEEDPHRVLAGALLVARELKARKIQVVVREAWALARRRVRDASFEGAFARTGLPIHVLSGGSDALVRAPVTGLTPAQLIGGLHEAATGRALTTRLVGVAGAVRRPALVEAPMDAPLEDLLLLGGGGPRGRRPWRMAVVGGPMGRVVPVERFGGPLPEGLGGSVVALDKTVSPRMLFAHLVGLLEAEQDQACATCRAGWSHLGGEADHGTLVALVSAMGRRCSCPEHGRLWTPLVDLVGFEEEAFEE